MKKSLAALAIIGALSASANAQDAVTVYGIVDAGMVVDRGNTAGSMNKLSSGAQSGTRIGFKGTEKIGALTGLFVLETGIAADAGGFNQGNGFARQSFVGLRGDFGTVTLGRQYSSYFLALHEADPFASGLAGTSSNLMANSGIRMNNTVKYASPLFQGFGGEIAYGFGEVAGNSTASRQVSASLGYSMAPLTIKLAHHNRRNAADTATSKNTMLTATMDFQVAKAFVAYAQNDGAASSPVPGVAPAAAATPSTIFAPFGTTATPSSKSRDYLIGVTAPFGPHTFIASYIYKDDRNAANNDANQIGLGYTYAFSKRTNLYAAWARIDNKRLASYTVGNNSEVGTGDKAFNLGVRHVF